MTVLPQLERELLAAHERRIERPRAAWMRPRHAMTRAGRWLAPVLTVAATIAVAAVFLVALRHGSPERGGTVTGGADTLVLQATVVRRNIPLSPAVDDSVGVLQRRFAAALPAVRASRVGDQIVLHGITPSNRAQAMTLVATGHLRVFDWEANALTPNGKTVASQLRSGDPTAMAMSQGSAAATGAQGSDGLSLYAAARLASRQPTATYSVMSHVGPQYYLFASPGSPACAAAARDAGVQAVAGQYCYLAGPAPSLSTLAAAAPRGVSAGSGQVLKVPQGTTLLEASDASPSSHLSVGSPDAKFFVLRDNEALSSGAITRPTRGTDATGSPDVTFGFTRAGEAAFQRTTSAVAHRGSSVSSLGQTLNQHFAVALDNQLISVPQIDFKTYPDGIRGSTADLAGNFTAQSARDLAAILRSGALEVSLTQP